MLMQGNQICNKYIIEVPDPYLAGLDHETIIGQFTKLTGCQYIALSDEYRSDIHHTMVFVLYEKEKKDTTILNKLKANGIVITATNRKGHTCCDLISRKIVSNKSERDYIVDQDYQTEWGHLPPEEEKQQTVYKTLADGSKVLNYSHQRIKQIFKDEYGYHLKLNHAGYKGNRHPNYVNTYQLLDEDDNIIMGKVTYDSLRMFFHRKGYPLKSGASQ